MSSPLFAHDCDNCTFLSSFNSHDLYYCKSEHETTVIARYGNNGDEYKSGMVFAEPHLNIELYKAKLQAIKKGLL